MANLKEVRDRISSVKSTQQITKAMKMVAAAKLRKAQMAITKMRPYSNKLNEMLTNILSNMEGGADTAYGTEREVAKVLLVVVTSDRGLCGAFNANIIKAAVAKIEGEYAGIRAEGNLSLMFVGKKGHDFFVKRYKDCTMIKDYVGMFSDLSFDNVALASQRLMDAFKAEEYDKIEVSYGRFKNAAVQFAEIEQFLPVSKLIEEEKDSKEKSFKADYLFEPDMETLLNTLIPSILQMQFQKFVLDTNASEHGARMTAMDKATENAEDLLKELKINYNKARQEAITNEISEIVGGVAALEG